jgi:hypothetical protein
VEIPQSEGVSLKAFYAKQGRLQRSQKPSTERIVLTTASDLEFLQLPTFLRKGSQGSKDLGVAPPCLCATVSS